MLFEAKVIKKNLKEKRNYIEIYVKDKNLKKIKYWIPRKFIHQVNDDYYDIDDLFIMRTIEESISKFEYKQKIYAILFNSIVNPKVLGKTNSENYLKIKQKRFNNIDKILKINEKQALGDEIRED